MMFGIRPEEATREIAPMTEAACLLQTGVLYGLRRGFRRASGDEVFIGVKPGAFSVYFGDAPIYHFDLDGRWQRAYLDGTHYLKGLDASVQAVERVREGENLVLRRRALGFAEASDLDATVRSAAIEVIEGLEASYEPLDPPGGARPLEIDRARQLLDRVISWDSAAWFAHRERYLSTYGPLPFLPPDAMNPVILQATLGHARGPGFGGEPAAEYYERTPAEFRDHARDVARLLGRRMLQTRQVFVAGADFLRLGADAAIALLDAAAEVLPIGPTPRVRARDADVWNDSPKFDGFQAFVHEFEGPAFSSEAWAELRSRHFRRLTLGIESGSATVRGLYQRGWENEALRGWVASCPVGVGLVVVVGAGGIEAATEHFEGTVALVASLPIAPGSLVTLVDADELDTRPDSGREFTPLDPPAMAVQRAELKGRLSAALGPRKVKVTTYSTEKRWQ